MPQSPQQNLDAMRQDAIRRSREMHRRAMPRRSQPPPPDDPWQPEPMPEPLPPPEPPPPEPPPGPPPHTPASGLNGLLDGLHLSDELRSLLTEWDGEKMALAALLYLLYKEGADPSLLLAIAYILL